MKKVMNLTNTSTTTVTMVRKFDVEPDLVFEAWINDEMMKKWFFTMEHTNQVAKNEPHVGGTWEIVDQRGGNDYRAIGEYIEITRPTKLVFTFKMPQFGELVDTLTVDFKAIETGCEMTFTQVINVPHEENWTDADIQKAQEDYNAQTEQGWHYMFLGLKQLVETGKIEYPS
jgi:uncharacterized protein YndB with AHSA1/START domain